MSQIVAVQDHPYYAVCYVTLTDDDIEGEEKDIVFSFPESKTESCTLKKIDYRYCSRSYPSVPIDARCGCAQKERQQILERKENETIVDVKTRFTLFYYYAKMTKDLNTTGITCKFEGKSETVLIRVI
uniref:ZP domain-containing protein n=1 Tax=Biomphalaria glabrata TaxID=6526 RepID=A0A2C9KN01_BIOGL